MISGGSRICSQCEAPLTRKQSQFCSIRCKARAQTGAGQPPVARICRQCTAQFTVPPYEVKIGRGIYCSQRCLAIYRHEQTDRAANQARWLAETRARNRAFVAEINARTVCAHCGRQPIEWHNPEHVELNRQGFRISGLASRGSSLEAIRTEMARCTPLCRRCHMREDGRLQAFVTVGRAAQSVGPLPCAECKRLYKPLRRGLCARCYGRLDRADVSTRPACRKRMRSLGIDS